MELHKAKELVERLMNIKVFQVDGISLSELYESKGFASDRSYAVSVIKRIYPKNNKFSDKSYDGNTVVQLQFVVWDKTDKDLTKLRESEEYKKAGPVYQSLLTVFTLAKNEYSYKLSFKVSYSTGKNAEGQEHPFSTFDFGGALRQAITAYGYEDNLSKAKKSAILKQIDADVVATIKSKGDTPYTTSRVVEQIGRIMLRNLINKVDSLDKLSDDTMLAASEKSVSKTDKLGKSYNVERFLVEAKFFETFFRLMGKVSLFPDVDLAQSTVDKGLVYYKDQNGEPVLSLGFGKVRNIMIDKFSSMAAKQAYEKTQLDDDLDDLPF